MQTGETGRGCRSEPRHGNKVVLVLVATVVTLLTTGCLSSDAYVTIDDDGSGELRMEVFPPLEVSDTIAGSGVDALIRSAFLRFSDDTTLEGAPFDGLGCLQIDFVEVTAPPDNTTYDAPGFFIGCESTPPNSIDVTFDVEDALIQEQNQLNLRLSFETDSNGDAVADLYVVRTAPTLEITYLLP